MNDIQPVGDYYRVNSAHVLLPPGEYFHVLPQERNEEAPNIFSQLGPDVNEVFWLVVKLYKL